MNKLDANIIISECKALYEYVNREMFNIRVVETMCEQILVTIKGAEKNEQNTTK